MDFVGGNELRIERVCDEECSDISPDSVLENLRVVSKNNNFQIILNYNSKIIIN
ncbi:MAG: hypothetical protein Ct9H90mP3_6690 [Flammeovirgaceae bacterium]|nr:MAG: hypothetical protein Ct9H90mP3_6690 [Flammeovirgaceae bacterium]